ncbi:MAG: GNAT family N-acetyltransferase [Halobacteriales archaeon]
MGFELLGWPPDGPMLDLDHERFAYAGKFVMSTTGKAVWRDGDVVAAVAFSDDRTDPHRLWLRYLTVRSDRRGEGIGPRLVEATVGRAGEQGYDLVAIAVNNPYAYEALYRAGFSYTGETTGVAELVLERPAADQATDLDSDRYRAGLARFAERDLTGHERNFLEAKRARGPPSPDVDPDT